MVAPLTTSAHFLTGEGTAPPWETSLSGALDPLFDFASPEAVYAAYGKLYFLVFLGFLLGLAGLYAGRREVAGRLERWGFYLSLAGFALNLFGNVFDYWHGGGVGESAPDFLGFLLGTILGLLLLTIGSAMLGTSLSGFRKHGLPKPAPARRVASRSSARFACQRLSLSAKTKS